MFKQLRQSAIIQITFVISIVLSIAVIYFIEQSRYQQKRLAVQNISNSYVNLIRNNVFQAISATYPLAAWVRTHHGDVTGF